MDTSKFDYRGNAVYTRDLISARELAFQIERCKDEWMLSTLTEMFVRAAEEITGAITPEVRDIVLNILSVVNDGEGVSKIKTLILRNPLIIGDMSLEYKKGVIMPSFNKENKTASVIYDNLVVEDSKDGGKDCEVFARYIGDDFAKYPTMPPEGNWSLSNIEKWLGWWQSPSPLEL